nr:hypothetical protein [Tanacetum cinerariifolium]
GLRHHSLTPQGAAVMAVPSSDRHHDGGLAADSPYSTPNHNRETTKLNVSSPRRRQLAVAVVLVVTMVAGVSGVGGGGCGWCYSDGDVTGDGDEAVGGGGDVV